MKLSPLLSQYLLTYKQLNLAGIGRFFLDDSIPMHDEAIKNLKGVLLGKIRFEQDPSMKEDPDLVAFIAEQTGKMKSLAAGDLDSHLELARQFLNIGKPFLLEGIGTLSKTKTGKLEFSQSHVSVEKLKDGTNEGKDITSTTEESFTNYEEMFSPKKPKVPASRRIVSWIVAATGIAIAVFGGYMLYNETKPKDKPVIQNPEATKLVVSPPDTSQKKLDSIPPPILEAPTKSVDGINMYRFVIETAARRRALYRYDFLKSNFIDVKMDTKDSVLFKLYFLLPSAPADTARKRDSLQRLYGTRSKTVIELN